MFLNWNKQNLVSSQIQRMKKTKTQRNPKSLAWANWWRGILIIGDREHKKRHGFGWAGERRGMIMSSGLGYVKENFCKLLSGKGNTFWIPEKSGNTILNPREKSLEILRVITKHIDNIDK